MARPVFTAIELKLDATAGVASEGTPLMVDCNTDHTIQVIGAFTGSIRVEFSDDGTMWVQSGSAITAPGISYHDVTAKYVRLRTAALSAGTPTAHHGSFHLRAV